MKTAHQITKLLFCTALLFLSTTAIEAQLNHQMIFRVNSPGVVW
jgi:hypothetical protein